jgi:hypothetical protein
VRKNGASGFFFYSFSRKQGKASWLKDRKRAGKTLVAFPLMNPFV